MKVATITQPLTPIQFAAGGLIDLSQSPWRRIMLSERDEVYALVDAEDYGWLSENTWNVSWGTSCPWKKYAKRNVGPERATVRMHREVLIVSDPRSEQFISKHHGDHVNGHGLDNRRANLRWATPKQNRANIIGRDNIPSLEAIVLELMQAYAAGQAMQELPF